MTKFLKTVSLVSALTSLSICVSAQEYGEDVQDDDLLDVPTQQAPPSDTPTLRQSAEEARTEEPEAGRDVRISISGMVSTTHPEVDLDGASATVDSDTGAGFGAFVQLKWRGIVDRENDIIDNLEIGTVLVRSKFQARNGDSLVEQEVNRLQFPVLVRTPLGKYFSVGAGPYIGFRVGAVEETVLVGPAANIDSTLEEDFEAGLAASAAFRYEFNEWLDAFVDARYSLNFSQTQDVSGFGGLAFRL